MYLYSFTRFNWPDKVFKIAEDILWPKSKLKAGDLLQLGSEYFLCLWKKVSFEEIYLHVAPLTSTNLELCYHNFLTKEAMTLLHWMIETYYTTYRSVMRLFLTDELEKLLERESKTKDKRWKTKDESSKESLIFNLWSLICAPQGQTLIVFPDLRTMTNSLRSSWEVEKLRCWEVILLASQTQNQKDMHRWEVKKGTKSVMICTYAEIFQDFHDLQKIIRVDPHKRYYANQQDPRYKVGEVLKKMAEIYGAKLEEVGV